MKKIQQNNNFISSIEALIEEYSSSAIPYSRQYLFEEMPLLMGGLAMGLGFEGVIPTLAPNQEKPPLLIVYPKKQEEVFKQSSIEIESIIEKKCFEVKPLGVELDLIQEDSSAKITCNASFEDIDSVRDCIKTKDKYLAFLISLGKPYHENEELKSTINLIDKLITFHKQVAREGQEQLDEELQQHLHDKWHIQIIVADSLQAYNYANNTKELEQFRQQFREKGDAWLQRALPIFERLKKHTEVDISVKRWDDLLKQAKAKYNFTYYQRHLMHTYQTQKEQVISLHKKNPQELKKTATNKKYSSLIEVFVHWISQLQNLANTNNNQINTSSYISLNYFKLFERMALRYCQSHHQQQRNIRILNNTSSTKKYPFQLRASDNEDDRATANSEFSLEKYLLRCYMKSLEVSADPIVCELLLNSKKSLTQFQPRIFSNAYSIARRNIDNMLAETFADTQNRNASTACFLIGKQGYGKKRAAYNYAEQYKERYSGQWWIAADKGFLLDKMFQKIARGLQIIEQKQGAKCEHDKQELIQLIDAYIQRQAKPVLLIFEDVKKYSAILPYLPKHNVHIIVCSEKSPNTRITAVVGTLQTISVGTLAPVEAHQLIQSQLSHIPELTETVIKQLSDTAQYSIGKLEAIITYIKQKGLRDNNIERYHQQTSEAIYIDVIESIIQKVFKNENDKKATWHLLKLLSVLSNQGVNLATAQDMLLKYLPHYIQKQNKKVEQLYKEFAEHNIIHCNPMDNLTLASNYAQALKLYALNERDFIASMARDLLNLYLDVDIGLSQDSIQDEFYPHLRALYEQVTNNGDPLLLADLCFILAVNNYARHPIYSQKMLTKAKELYQSHINNDKPTDLLLLLIFISIREQYFDFLINSGSSMVKGIHRHRIELVKSVSSQLLMKMTTRSKSLFADRLHIESFIDHYGVVLAQTRLTTLTNHAIINNGFNIIEIPFLSGHLEIPLLIADAMINYDPDANITQLVSMSRQNYLLALDIYRSYFKDANIIILSSYLQVCRSYKTEENTEAAQRILYEKLLPSFEYTKHRYRQYSISVAALYIADNFPKLSPMIGEIRGATNLEQALRCREKFNFITSKCIYYYEYSKSCKDILPSSSQEYKTLENFGKAIPFLRNMQSNNFTPTQLYNQAVQLSQQLRQNNLYENMVSRMKERSPESADKIDELDKYIRCTTPEQPKERVLSTMEDIRNNKSYSVKALIDFNIDPNTPDPQGNTYLHVAVKYCRIEIIKLLLTHDRIDTTIKNKQGKTAFALIPANRYSQVISQYFCQHWLNKATECREKNKPHKAYAFAHKAMLTIHKQTKLHTTRLNSSTNHQLNTLCEKIDDVFLDLAYDKVFKP